MWGFLKRVAANVSSGISNFFTNVRVYLEFWFAPRNLEPVTEVKDVESLLNLWAPQCATLKTLNFLPPIGRSIGKIYTSEARDKFLSRLELCTHLEKVYLGDEILRGIFAWHSEGEEPPVQRFIHGLERSCATLTEITFSSCVLPNIAGVQSDVPSEMDIENWKSFCEFISKCQSLQSIRFPNSAMMRLFHHLPLQTKQLMDALASCPKLETIDFSGNTLFSSWKERPIETTVANSSSEMPTSTSSYWPPLLELFRNPNLETLELRGMFFSSLSMTQWQELATAAKAHPKLSILDLSVNGLLDIPDAAYEAIVELFKGTGGRLKTLLFDMRCEKPSVRRSTPEIAAPALSITPALDRTREAMGATENPDPLMTTVRDARDEVKAAVLRSSLRASSSLS